MKVKDCIGKTCIVQMNPSTSGNYIEVKFIKLSKMEKMVLEEKKGVQQWDEVAKYDSRWRIVDVLE